MKIPRLQSTQLCYNIKKIMNSSLTVKMWKIMFISISFLSFSHSSSFPDTMSGSISDSKTKSISSVTENDLGHFVSIVNPVLATIDGTKHLISPTQSMNTSQLIEHYGGYKTEEHTVISDGYKLNMVRIPGDGPSVFLMHGLFTSSDDWMGLGNNSLPLLLSRRGYDVWIGNARGNTYSRENIYLPPTDPKFWDFSFDEMGRCDLAVCIDYICDTVGEEKKLLYVGHSQGTTMVYILLSERPEYNKKLKGVVSLASISFISNAKSPLFQLMIKLRKTVEAVFKALDFYEVFPHRPPISTLTTISASSKLLSTIFLTVLFSLIGFDYKQIDYNHTRDQLSHYPAGSSLKQILHYLQIGANDIFCPYDYGKRENMNKYGTSTPPPYKLENISTNMTLFYGANDWLSDIKDVKKLTAKLPKAINLYKVKLCVWNHMDYQWGKNAPKLVFIPVIKILDHISSS